MAADLPPPSEPTKRIVFAAEGDWLHGSLGRIVVRLQEAVVEVGPQPLHPGQGVADRLGQFGFAGDLRELGVQPGFEILEDRFGLRLPDLDPLIGRKTAGLFLHAV